MNEEKYESYHAQSKLRMARMEKAKLLWKNLDGMNKRSFIIATQTECGVGKGTAREYVEQAIMGGFLVYDTYTDKITYKGE